MPFIRKTIMGALAGGALLCLAVPSVAAQPAQGKDADQLMALADRAAINDLIVDYYAQIGTKDHDFSAFFVPDGRLDVNGRVVTGYDQIHALYDAASGGVDRDMGSKQQAGQIPRGRFDMLFSNLKVTVSGNSAVATLNWYSVLSEKLVFPPAVTEYGREKTQLVKRDGVWRIASRTVISDGGMPDSELKTYQAW